MDNNFYDKVYYKLGGDNDIKQPSSAKIREVEFLKSLSYPESGKKLLDIGCGTGAFLKSLKESEADLWGIDISVNATNIAKKILSKPEQIICKNACPLPFGDNEFDYVTAWGTIEHFPSILSILEEIKRVTKCGGKIAIMVPNVYYYKFIWDAFRKGSGPTKHQETEFFYSFKEWKDLIQNAGLSVLKISGHNKFNKHPITIWLRNIFIPFYFSNHFVFICTKKEN